MDKVAASQQRGYDLRVEESVEILLTIEE